MPDRPSFDLEVLGHFVEPKERARTGRNGHHYTPTDTRRFEAMVKEAAMLKVAQTQFERFNCAVTVHLQIFDGIPPGMPEWLIRLAKAGLYFEHTGGDLDNKEKAVLDALNKVVYRDDRLVVQNYKFRRFDKEPGFKINVSACGLTKHDVEIIGKLIGQKHAEKESTR